MFCTFVLGSLSLGYCSFLVSAEPFLYISGPSTVFEGDIVEFYITLNGEPVQARIIFEGDSSVRYSHPSSGMVSILMPLVGFAGKSYTITATTLDGAYTTTSDVFVKNALGTLTLELPSEPIYEMQQFTICVRDGSQPVPNATVRFLSSVYTTNTSGCVLLDAPDVLVSTTYSLSVHKTGYLSVSTMITIHEAGVGQQMMDIVVPFFVKLGQTHIRVQALSKTGGLQNTTVVASYEETQYAQYQTDAQGEAVVETPDITGATSFSVSIYKQGYETYDAEHTATVHFLSYDNPKTLTIQSDVTLVPEGSLMTLLVTDHLGNPVQGATIWKGDREVEKTTDAQGMVTLSIPYVFFDKMFYLYATKPGYNFAEKPIVIQKHEVQEEPLYISVDTSVYVSEWFTVQVTDSADRFVNNATVSFNLLQKQTDEQGSTSFLAPMVTSETFYPIKVTKCGFLPASAFIRVIPMDQRNDSSELHIYVTPQVPKNAEFTITIRDNFEYPVMGARVSFRGMSQTTDHRGMVLFTAPNVVWDTYATVSATKDGYLSASVDVLVVNTEGLPYWFFILIVVIVFAIGIAAHIWYRPYRI